MNVKEVYCVRVVGRKSFEGRIYCVWIGQLGAVDSRLLATEIRLPVATWRLLGMWMYRARACSSVNVLHNYCWLLHAATHVLLLVAACSYTRTAVTPTYCLALPPFVKSAPGTFN